MIYQIPFVFEISYSKKMDNDFFVVLIYLNQYALGKEKKKMHLNISD